MKILKTNPGCNLFLGNQGEKLALQIVFDIGPWINTYGAGTAHLLHQRKGDTEPYLVATVQEGTEVRWDVTDADTAVEGNGRYELHFYTGESLVKSVTGDALVRGSLRYGVDPPEAVQLWLDHVAEEEHKIYQAVVDSEAAKAAAETAADTSVAAAGNAATSEKAAAASQKAAGESAGKAAASEREAAKSAKNAGQSANEASDSAAAARKSAEDLAAAESNAAESANNAAQSEQNAINAQNAATEAAQQAEKSAKLADNQAKTASDFANQAMEHVADAYLHRAKAERAAEAAEASAEEAKKAAESAGGGMGGADWNANEGEPGHVLNRTHWVEGGMVEILPLTELALDEEGLGELPFLNLVAGETYVVNWNGTKYSCVAQLPDPSKATDIALGNLATMGQPDTGEPFVMIFVQEFNLCSVATFDGTVSTEISVSIKGKGEVVHKLPGKYLPDGVPYVEEGEAVDVLPETSVQFTDGEAMIETPISLVIGETYTVNWNGVDYECVAQDASVIEEGVVCIGNGAPIGLSGNNEPFIIASIANAGVTAIMAVDGASEATFSVKYKKVTIHKIDPRCLPDNVGGGGAYTVVFDAYVSGNGFDVTADRGYAEVYEKAINPNAEVKGCLNMYRSAEATTPISTTPLIFTGFSSMADGTTTVDFLMLSYGNGNVKCAKVALHSDETCVIYQ